MRAPPRRAMLQVAHRGDPADWLIAATALELQVKLVSSDRLEVQRLTLLLRVL